MIAIIVLGAKWFIYTLYVLKPFNQAPYKRHRREFEIGSAAHPAVVTTNGRDNRLLTRMAPRGQAKHGAKLTMSDAQVLTSVCTYDTLSQRDRLPRGRKWASWGSATVGLPLALASIEAGFRVIGFDINSQRVKAIR